MVEAQNSDTWGPGDVLIRKDSEKKIVVFKYLENYSMKKKFILYESESVR